MSRRAIFLWKKGIILKGGRTGMGHSPQPVVTISPVQFKMEQTWLLVQPSVTLSTPQALSLPRAAQLVSHPSPHLGSVQQLQQRAVKG
ncbi:hypothetical protein EK904_008803 [Melospiza melodia maxima]|nr:hypothetical protein EK904_008803 [Melospiza melodia maxima]